MAVLTISRESGSEGNLIGKKVAEALGYKFIFKKEIEDIFEEYGFTSFSKRYDMAHGLWAKIDEATNLTIDFMKKVILSIARIDNVVIIGRGGFAILNDYTNVVNVRIHAPFDFRLSTLTNEKIKVNSVEEYIINSDKSRIRFLESYFNVMPNDVKKFDLVINTGKVPVDSAISWIIDGINRIEKNSNYNMKSTAKTISVDKVLDEFIESYFKK